MNYNPRIERGKSNLVTLEYHKLINGNDTIVKIETREFSLNFFTRGRKKVGA